MKNVPLRSKSADFHDFNFCVSDGRTDTPSYRGAETRLKSIDEGGQLRKKLKKDEGEEKEEEKEEKEKNHVRDQSLGIEKREEKEKK